MKGCASLFWFFWHAGRRHKRYRNINCEVNHVKAYILRCIIKTLDSKFMTLTFLLNPKTVLQAFRSAHWEFEVWHRFLYKFSSHLVINFGNSLWIEISGWNQVMWSKRYGNASKVFLFNPVFLGQWTMKMVRKRF